MQVEIVVFVIDLFDLDVIILNYLHNLYKDMVFLVNVLIQIILKTTINLVNVNFVNKIIQVVVTIDL